MSFTNNADICLNLTEDINSREQTHTHSRQVETAMVKKQSS